MAIAYRYKGHVVNGRPQEFHAILPARNIQEDELPELNEEQRALLKISTLYTAIERKDTKTADKPSKRSSKASDADETVDSTLDDDAAPMEPAATDKE